MVAMIVCGALLVFTGFAAASLSIDRHYAEVHGRGREQEPGLRRRLRALGWGALLLALLACGRASGWHIGPVLWCGLMTAEALLLALLLRYAPRRVAPLARAALAGALVFALLALG